MTDLLNVTKLTAQHPAAWEDMAPRTRCKVDVVICDDHAMFVGGLADALSSEKTDVLGTTHDPDHLASLVGELKPDVCLLGARYSGVERLDVLTEVHRASPTTTLIVVAATTTSHLWEAWNSGEVDVIVSKECNLAEIKAAIDRASDGERFTIGIERPRPARPFGPGRTLTAREDEVLRLMVAGATTSEMSGSLGISIHTVRTHVQHLLDKLGVGTRVQAARIAVEQGIVVDELGDSRR